MPGGSRFLYEPFRYGPKEFQEAQETILEMKFAAVDMRLERIEMLMERMERRLWLTVYGVVAVILTHAVRTLLMMTPTGGP
ncbi:hypothetical protein ICN82_16185 [Mangrovicoccus sp. HB182678]|uniref:Uncharacterized protein n=2 Tax=Mangrovicoccus algicola TaxID=2771008 RepID=A0A8J6YXV8_9RHOB|nr:hypothetical protein [Mangrovicoccus algicola]MBE3639742.1 hypothetical protein [Mangrovicoccus algicola]